MPAPWKSVLVIAVLCVAVGPAADPPKPYQLPLTPFEILAVVHGESSDDAVIRKLKDSGTRFAPGAPELRQLRQLGVSDKILAAITTEPQVVQATFTTPLPPAKSGRPVGTWVREVGDMRIVLKFTEDRLTVTANMPSPDGDVLMTADADYSVNPEGLLFGVISGIDANQPEAAAEIQMLTGHTFSTRCRVDGTTLTVKDMKAFGSGLNKNDGSDDFAGAMQMACGRYSRDDNAKPITPKKAKPQTEKAIASGTLNKLHNQPGNQYPIPYPPLPPEFAAPPTMAPPGSVVQAGGPIYPNPQASWAAPPPMMASSTPPSKLVGSWIRETEGTQLIAKFTEKRVFLTVNMALLNGEQECRMTARIEADYAIGPDGTAFGVITGTDFTPPKGDPDSIGFADMMSEVLTSLHSVPFYFRFRIDEGNLTLRELHCVESLQHNTNARMVLVGRYKPLGNQAPAPPKPVKMKLNDVDPPGERIGVDFNRPETLPTPPYLKLPPQFFPPDSLFPLPRELDSTIRVREVAPAPRAVPPR